MTEEQVALYGSMIGGPIALGITVLLYLWYQNAPLTKRGARKAAERMAELEEVVRRRQEDRERRRASEDRPD